MGQGDLINCAVQILSGDDRVRGVWLTGSYGRGTNDKFSDVDLWVAVEPAGVAGQRESVISAHLACAELFLPLARRLHARCEIAWPQALEDALRRHLDKTLTVPLPGSA